jgi:hypothetical protein
MGRRSLGAARGRLRAVPVSGAGTQASTSLPAARRLAPRPSSPAVPAPKPSSPLLRRRRRSRHLAPWLGRCRSRCLHARRRRHQSLRLQLHPRRHRFQSHPLHVRRRCHRRQSLRPHHHQSPLPKTPPPPPAPPMPKPSPVAPAPAQELSPTTTTPPPPPQKPPAPPTPRLHHRIRHGLRRTHPRQRLRWLCRPASTLLPARAWSWR